MSEIESASEGLAEEFLSDRDEKENARNGLMVAMMSFYDEKLRVTSTRAQGHQMLSESQEKFIQVNTIQLKSLQCRSKEHEQKAQEERQKIKSLKDFEDERATASKTADTEANRAREACAKQLGNISRKMHSLLCEARSTICDTREKIVEKDRARHELCHTKKVVEVSVAELGKRAEEHDKLSQQAVDSAKLLVCFQDMIVKGFAGLANQLEFDAAFLLEELPDDQGKMMAVYNTYEDDIGRQKRVIRKSSEEKLDKRREVEKELRTLEQQRRKDPARFEFLKAQFQEFNDDLRHYELDLDFLEGQLVDGSDKQSKFREDLETMCPDLDPAAVQQSAAHWARWVNDFHFNTRKCSRFEPPQRMLICDPEFAALTDGSHMGPEKTDCVGSLNSSALDAAWTQVDIPVLAASNQQLQPQSTPTSNDGVDIQTGADIDFRAVTAQTKELAVTNLEPLDEQAETLSKASRPSCSSLQKHDAKSNEICAAATGAKVNEDKQELRSTGSKDWGSAPEQDAKESTPSVALTADGALAGSCAPSSDIEVKPRPEEANKYVSRTEDTPKTADAFLLQIDAGEAGDAVVSVQESDIMEANTVSDEMEWLHTPVSRMEEREQIEEFSTGGNEAESLSNGLSITFLGSGKNPKPRLRSTRSRK
jgi:hypothetical protein